MVDLDNIIKLFIELTFTNWISKIGYLETVFKKLNRKWKN